MWSILSSNVIKISATHHFSIAVKRDVGDFNKTQPEHTNIMYEIDDGDCVLFLFWKVIE